VVRAADFGGGRHENLSAIMLTDDDLYSLQIRLFNGSTATLRGQLEAELRIQKRVEGCWRRGRSVNGFDHVISNSTIQAPIASCPAKGKRNRFGKEPQHSESGHRKFP
jgi:hypothetical protein